MSAILAMLAGTLIGLALVAWRGRASLPRVDYALIERLEYELLGTGEKPAPITPSLPNVDAVLKELYAGHEERSGPPPRPTGLTREQMQHDLARRMTERDLGVTPGEPYTVSVSRSGHCQHNYANGRVVVLAYCREHSQ